MENFFQLFLVLTMKRFDLELRESSQYHSFFDPTIHNEFATAAFRFGHSIIPSNLRVINSPEERTRDNRCPLSMLFNEFEDFVIGADYSGKAWQNLLHGLAKTPSALVFHTCQACHELSVL